jgi:hypothetical protein
MTLIKSMNVDPEILKETLCDNEFACLSGKATCNVELFVDRELELLRCKEESACEFKRNYNGQFICTCPVNKASFGLT